MAGDDRLRADSTHALGANGYTALLTGAGDGGSYWHGLAVTRWGPRDRVWQPGSCCYVRDVVTGAHWSATTSPCGSAATCWANEAMVRYALRNGAITTTLEVAIDPDHAVEVRGIGLHNGGRSARTLEVTSYSELCLNAARADAAHPAYSKMFVQTAFEDGVLLAWRRKKDPSEPDIWAAHALVIDGAEAAPREWETDRARFIGRDHSLAAPAALQADQPLSGTVGTVLDPVFSLRGRVTVRAGETRRVAFVTAVGATRDEVLACIRGYLTPAACAAVFSRAALGDSVAESEAATLQRFVGALAGSDDAWRAATADIAAAQGGAPVLWAKGISGDIPIVLAKVSAVAQTALIAELVQAQRWWRARQLPADLVALNTADAAHADAVDAALQPLVAAAGQSEKSQGNVFTVRADAIDARLRAGLAAAACIVLDGARGGLAAQVVHHAGTSTSPVTAVARVVRGIKGDVPSDLPSTDALKFWNGTGGFSADGSEYVTVLRGDGTTPAPWSNLIANPGFGFLVTAAGGGYAWAGNSQQNPITRWSNDAVSDPAGETFLCRDMETGAEWSATPSPLRVAGATYVVRFGAGYARFTTCVAGIESELVLCVAESAPVKLARLVLTNRSSRPRRIAVAHTVAWLLGAIGSDPRATTVVESDARRHAVFARNAWRDEFAAAVACMACSADGSTVGSTVGPRSASVVTLDLAPGARVATQFMLGEGADRAAAEALVDQYRRADFDAELRTTRQAWDDVLQPLQIRTPEPSIDVLVNRWLPYQVVACRLWARTAFYQASGAYGFRDQLQDGGALCLTRPDIARAQILLAASRQFAAGDAQHWWLPPSGRGVRTRIVDDRLWLPYIVAHYVACTGDAAVLDACVPFLRGAPLQPGQTDAFFQPESDADAASVFEHCARAIDVSLATGVHGLPLMGTGDWNDGMNRVGAGGKGESVWMGWFLSRVIADFAPHAERRDDPRAVRWRDAAKALQVALETKAWDGAWYRRAFYDDGTPLGTSADTECRIESMAQSWAVISGAGDKERAKRAMQAVDAQLVRPRDGLVALFTAPFDATAHDPGYIKGYPPGLRENGGQYTHGSIWSLIAFALQGEGDKVGELLEIFDPIRHADHADKLARYKVEPYVECADVYSVAPHVGRGGWTWYSGSAGWLYRAIVEWVLGLHPSGDRLRIEPCIPRAWDGFSLTWRYRRTTYRIAVANPSHICHGVAIVELDGVTLSASPAGVALVDDGATHDIHVTLQKEPS